MIRIGLYGGTFNPPHMGHVHAACAAVEALRLDRLLLIPDRLPPHKELPQGTPDEAHRLEMTRIAARSIPGGEACGVELQMPPPSYTAFTAAYMARLYPDAERWWIVGTDMLLTLHRWYRPEEIFANCRIAALARGADDREALKVQAVLLRERFGAAVDVVDAPAYPVSSTQLRQALREGKKDLRDLPPGVEAYIRKERLYLG